MKPTVVKTAMPVLFHEPYVETGFRPVHQPWSKYFMSIFRWHNELMNIWTHLVALFMVLVRAGYWCTEFDIWSDPYMWPLGVSFITMIALYSCSAFAHCFHNRSELAHFVCFMIDYCGIGLYGFGSTMLHYWYCSHENFIGSYFNQLAVPIGAILGVFTCYCCSLSKVKYKRPYPFERRLWQMGSVASIYTWLTVPIVMKITMYVFEGKWETSFGDHITQTLWFVLGGFFFGSDIPQRYFPGRFDFVGHGHQLFHICIMMTTSKQMDGVYYDIKDGIDELRQTPAPTWLGTWGWLIFVMTGSAYIVYDFYKSVMNNLMTVVDVTGGCCNGHEKHGNVGEFTAKSFKTNGHVRISPGVIDIDASGHHKDGSGGENLKHRNGWKVGDGNDSL